ncbi:MAG: alpha/beta hydrolase, partial [Gemmatimonadaceae bacterium]
ASIVLAGTLAAQTAAPRLERSTVKVDDGESLVVWAKHPTGHVVGSILLLHGRTWAALPNFDLHVGGESRSTMDLLAASGYAVYALDQRGYGATARDTSGWLTPDRAARDASEVLDWITARESRSGASHGARPALLGYSRGTLTALLTAQRYPDKLSSLIVYGLIYDSRTRGAHTPDPATPPRKHTTATAAGEDFITPEAAPPSVKDAYVRAALLRDTVRVDWKDENEFDVLDPHAIHMPVLVLNGERDPYVKESEAPAFFAQLGSIDRTWVVLSNSDHVAHLERPRDFAHAITSFLGRVKER